MRTENNRDEVMQKLVTSPLFIKIYARKKCFKKLTENQLNSFRQMTTIAGEAPETDSEDEQYLFNLSYAKVRKFEFYNFGTKILENIEIFFDCDEYS